MYLKTRLEYGEGFPGGSAVKNPPAMPKTQEMVWIPGSVRFPEIGGNSSPLQYSCLESFMGRAVHGAAKNGTGLND